jgi:hypothetical protein
MFDYQLLYLFVLCTVHISCYFAIELAVAAAMHMCNTLFFISFENLLRGCEMQEQKKYMQLDL